MDTNLTNLINLQNLAENAYSINNKINQINQINDKAKEVEKVEKISKIEKDDKTKKIKKIKKIIRDKKLKSTKIESKININPDKSFFWQIDENIELTVALPALNAEKIIYLALESLKNQKDIEFNWELIIMEENGKSVNIAKKYINILPKCVKILYLAINKKILLLNKWKKIAQLADDNSKIFVLHAADCYSPPKRLSIHYEHFKNKDCYFSTQVKGLFYNIINDKKIFYDGNISEKGKYIEGNHLNMAAQMIDIRRIPIKSITNGIDTYIRRYIKSKNKLANKKYIFTDDEIDKENWKYSLDTDGCNNISIARRKNYYKPRKPFVDYGRKEKFGYISVKSYIPNHIINFLNNL